MYKAKNHRKFMVKQLRESKIEGGLRWNYYKEARELIIKGLKIRNGNINSCVEFITRALLQRWIRKYEKMGRNRVEETKRLLLEQGAV